ncbi:Methylosome subunit pICln, partial [Stegodyphus mimosarum]
MLLKNYAPPTEGIHHAEPNVTAYFGDKNLGKGTLYISESVLCWLTSSGDGFSLSYPSIYIHAISKDLNNFPYECLYLMIDEKITISEVSEIQDEVSEDQELRSALNNLAVEEEEDDSLEPAEMHFVPDNKNMLDVMYKALCDCQALHPDSPTKDEDDDDEIVLPPISIQHANGVLEEMDDVVEDDSDMDEEQFEDAEQ